MINLKMSYWILQFLHDPLLGTLHIFPKNQCMSPCTTIIFFLLQLAVIANRTRAETLEGLKTVDWADFLVKMQQLQQRLGTTLSSPLSVTQFFAYPANISSWAESIISPILSMPLNTS